MANAIEYALMAGASYLSTRSDINKFPVPQGWVAVTNPPHFKTTGDGAQLILSRVNNPKGTEPCHAVQG